MNHYTQDQGCFNISFLGGQVLVELTTLTCASTSPNFPNDFLSCVNSGTTYKARKTSSRREQSLSLSHTRLFSCHPYGHVAFVTTCIVILIRNISCIYVLYQSVYKFEEKKETKKNVFIQLCHGICHFLFVLFSQFFSSSKRNIMIRVFC